MTIETNRDQASTLLRVALEDNELGNWRDALDHARDAVNFLADIAEQIEVDAFAKQMAQEAMLTGSSFAKTHADGRMEHIDRAAMNMTSADLEELLQSGGIK